MQTTFTPFANCSHPEDKVHKLNIPGPTVPQYAWCVGCGCVIQRTDFPQVGEWSLKKEGTERERKETLEWLAGKRGRIKLD